MHGSQGLGFMLGPIISTLDEKYFFGPRGQATWPMGGGVPELGVPFLGSLY